MNVSEPSSLPSFTIVTPSFNQGDFLEETIQSVLGQDYPALEYVIMDGGSTDCSVDIIRKYESRLFHWESHKDSGHADATYRGFERGVGELLGWVSSDDLLLPECLHKVGRYFAMHPEVVCVIGGAVIIDSESRPLRSRTGTALCNLGNRMTFDKLLFKHCSFNQPASFWRRSAFEAAGGFDRSLKFCHDYDMYFRLAQQGPFGRIKDWLACFRLHSMSKTSNLQDLCAAENEILWRKYGRYEAAPVKRKALAAWYAIEDRFRWAALRLELATGMRRCPDPRAARDRQHEIDRFPHPA